MRKLSFSSLVFLLALIPLKNIFAYDYNTPNVTEDASASIEDAIRNDAIKQDIKLLRCEKCWFVGLGVGAGSVTSKDTVNNIDNGSGFPPPGNMDQYTTNGSNPWAALISANFGYRFLIEPGWPKAVSVGLKYRFLLNGKVEGNTIEETNPTTFNNYDFTLSSDSNVLTLFAKVNLANFGDFSPYVSAGVGGDINSTNYSETATGATARISPNFSSKTNFGFAYELGAGVDYYLRRLVILSLGYDYLYLGAAAATGNGTVNWSTSSLNFGAQTANTVLFQTTFIFNA